MVKRLLFKYLPEGSAARNVSMLAGGAGIGQIAMALALPVLTRLYTPEEFGVLAVYAGLLGVFSTVSGLRYELAIPLPKTDGSAANILILSILCVVITSVILACFVGVYLEQIPKWLNTAAIEPFLWLLPVGVFFSGLQQSFTYWAIRRNNFRCIARTKIQQGVGSASIQVLLGLLHLGPLGLIFGGITAQSGGAFGLIYGAYQRDFQLWPRICKDRIKQRARRYSRFPKYSTWAAFANTGSIMIPPIVLASIFSTEIAGMYLLAHRVLLTPLNLVANSISQVFQAKAVAARLDGTLDQLVVNTFSHLILISATPLAIVGYYAPEVFFLLFGEKWEQAGIYAQWMIPWVAIQFVTSPISIVASVLEKQSGNLWTQLCLFIIRISALLIGAQYGVSEAILYYSISGVIGYGIRLFWIFHISVLSYRVVLKIISINILMPILVLIMLNIM